MISGTITDQSGRTLSGQTAEAFWISVAHARPLSIGLNCALGAEGAAATRAGARPRGADARERLSQRRPARTTSAATTRRPRSMAAVLRRIRRHGLVNIVGGCCGTTPEHIRAIAEAVRGLPPRAAARRRSRGAGSAASSR